MHDLLRERLLRSLDTLPDDRLYQVLDYVEFLSSKYARSGVKPSATSLRRFGERLEDHMRMNGVGLNAIRGTLGIVGTADRVVTDLTDTGRSILKDVEKGLRSAAEPTEPVEPAQVRDLPPGEETRSDS